MKIVTLQSRWVTYLSFNTYRKKYVYKARIKGNLKETDTQIQNIKSDNKIVNVNNFLSQKYLTSLI